jgi:hypothetical protein
MLARQAFLFGRLRTGFLATEIKQGLARVELDLMIRMKAIVVERISAAPQRGIERQAEIVQALRQLRLGLGKIATRLRQFQLRMREHRPAPAPIPASNSPQPQPLRNGHYQAIDSSSFASRLRPAHFRITALCFAVCRH